MVVLDPVGAYVVKTRDVAKNEKVFINVCTDPQISPPTNLDPADIALQVTRGENWTVPIVVSISRQDLDKAGNPSMVVDCCMNPQVVMVGIEDPSVKVLTVETCLESVEDRYQIVLSRDYKFPRMKVKNQLIKTQFDPGQPKQLGGNGPHNMEPEAILKETQAALGTGPTQPLSNAEPPESTIEVLESKEALFYLHIYRGPYHGQVRPTHEVEIGGEQRNVQLIGMTLKLAEKKLELPYAPSKYQAFCHEDTTHIMLWR